jgi:hypothetical protein
MQKSGSPVACAVHVRFIVHATLALTGSHSIAQFSGFTARRCQYKASLLI